MKISGFTIIKNAVINDYPIVEAIRSILPVVDEMIVSVGKSDDDTELLIRSIPDRKIKIVHSEWDPALRQGGKILAVERPGRSHRQPPVAGLCGSGAGRHERGGAGNQPQSPVAGRQSAVAVAAGRRGPA